MLLYQLIPLIIYIIWSICSIYTIIKYPKELFKDYASFDDPEPIYKTKWTNYWIIISSIIIIVFTILFLLIIIPWNYKIF